MTYVLDLGGVFSLPSNPSNPSSSGCLPVDKHALFGLEPQPWLGTERLSDTIATFHRQSLVLQESRTAFTNDVLLAIAGEPLAQEGPGDHFHQWFLELADINDFNDTSCILPKNCSAEFTMSPLA